VLAKWPTKGHGGMTNHGRASPRAGETLEAAWSALALENSNETSVDRRERVSWSIPDAWASMAAVRDRPPTVPARPSSRAVPLRPLVHSTNHQLPTASHARWLLQDDRRAPPQPHALGAETLRRDAHLTQLLRCRPDTPASYDLDSILPYTPCLTHTNHARQRPLAACARRRRRARPVRPDNPQAADRGRQPRLAAEAVQLL
jgi:hypothetical protein